MRPLVRRLLQFAAIALAAAIVFDAQRLGREAAINGSLAAAEATGSRGGTSAAANAGGTVAPAAVSLAFAAPGAAPDPRLLIVAARRAGAQGDVTGAASLLRRASDSGPPEVRAIALYDLGNLYLRAALRSTLQSSDAAAADPGSAAADPAQAGTGDRAPASMPLFELAKENYRSALYLDPGLWDARFNLELALRALPDSETDQDETAAKPQSERALTTMRGYTLGLP